MAPEFYGAKIRLLFCQCLEGIIYKRLQIWRHNCVISRIEHLILRWRNSPWTFAAFLV